VCNFWWWSVKGFGRGNGISHFPIDLRRRPCNTLALPCECVISRRLLNNVVVVLAVWGEYPQNEIAYLSTTLTRSPTLVYNNHEHHLPEDRFYPQSIRSNNFLLQNKHVSIGTKKSNDGNIIQVISPLGTNAWWKTIIIIE